MAKGTQAGRLSGPGAAGGADPGTTNTTAVVTHLRVASKAPEGFRRCGRHWGPEPVEVDADEFTEEEILRLLGEPELIVAAVTGGLAASDE